MLVTLCSFLILLTLNHYNLARQLYCIYNSQVSTTVIWYVNFIEYMICLVGFGDGWDLYWWDVVAISLTFSEQNILIGRLLWNRSFWFVWYRNMSIAIDRLKIIYTFYWCLFVELATKIELLFDNVMPPPNTCVLN